MGFTETAVFFKKRFGIEDSLEEIKAAWISMATEKYCNEVPLKDGVKEFLGYLKEQQIPSAICSSNSIELIKMVLKAHEIDNYFKNEDYIISLASKEFTKMFILQQQKP